MLLVEVKFIKKLDTLDMIYSMRMLEDIVAFKN